MGEVEAYEVTQSTLPLSPDVFPAWPDRYVTPFLTEVIQGREKHYSLTAAGESREGREGA